MAQTLTEEKPKDEVEKALDELNNSPDKPVELTPGESLNQAAQEIIANATNTVDDTKAMIDSFSKNAEFQTAPFIEAQTYAHEQIDSAWVGLNTGMEQILKAPAPEAPKDEKGPFPEETQPVIDIPQTSEIAPEKPVEQTPAPAEKTPDQEIPYAKVATPEEIKAAREATRVPRYSPEVIVPPPPQEARPQFTKEFISEKLQSIADVKEAINSTKTESVKPRPFAEVRQEYYQNKKAERTIEENPNPEVTTEQKNWYDARNAEAFAEGKQETKQRNLYDDLRQAPFLKPFKGLIDRLEASSAAEKANKLSQKLTKVEAKIALNLKMVENASSPEEAAKATEKVGKLREKQEKLQERVESYESRRDRAVENTVLRMNEKIAPRKEKAEQIKENIDNLELKINNYKDYIKQKEAEIKKIEQSGSKYRGRTIKALNKEIAKSNAAIKGFTKDLDKFQFKYVKVTGVIHRWEADSNSFSELKENNRSEDRESPLDSFGVPNASETLDSEPFDDSEPENDVEDSSENSTEDSSQEQETETNTETEQEPNTENAVEKPTTASLEDLIDTWNDFARREQNAGNTFVPFIEQGDLTRAAKRRENRDILEKVQKLLTNEERDALDDKTVSPKAFKLFLNEYMKAKDLKKGVSGVGKIMNDLIAETFEKNNVPGVNVENVLISEQKERRPRKKVSSKDVVKKSPKAKK